MVDRLQHLFRREGAALEAHEGRVHERPRENAVCPERDDGLVARDEFARPCDGCEAARAPEQLRGLRRPLEVDPVHLLTVAGGNCRHEHA